MPGRAGRMTRFKLTGRKSVLRFFSLLTGFSAHDRSSSLGTYAVTSCVCTNEHSVSENNTGELTQTQTVAPFFFFFS